MMSIDEQDYRQHPRDGCGDRIREAVKARYHDQDRRDDGDADDRDARGDVPKPDDEIGRVSLQHSAGLHEPLPLPPCLAP